MRLGSLQCHQCCASSSRIASYHLRPLRQHYSDGTGLSKIGGTTEVAVVFCVKRSPGRALQEKPPGEKHIPGKPGVNLVGTPLVLIDVPMSSRGRRRWFKTLLWYSGPKRSNSTSTLISGAPNLSHGPSTGSRTPMRVSSMKPRAESADPTPVRQTAARKKQYLLSRSDLVSTRRNPPLQLDQSKAQNAKGSCGFPRVVAEQQLKLKINRTGKGFHPSTGTV